MATTVTKALLGREDIDIQDSTTTTFSRATSTGGTTSITSLGRHTFNTREYDVTQWGAVGNGSTDDTAAIQAAIDAAEAAGGGTIVFPAGYTFRVQPTAVNTPIFTLASGNLTFVGYGATIKVTATTSLDPTTMSNEGLYAWVFKATGYDNINFLGLTFNGNRDDATQDPRYGFFMGVKCSHGVVRDCLFQNANTYHGHIRLTAWDAAAGSGEQITDWVIENNVCEQSNAFCWIEESQRAISIRGNTLRNMNLGPYDFTNGPAFTDTSYASANTKICRGIRLDGFGNTTAATHGEITDIEVTNNKIYGAAWSIEFWNNNDTNGDNPDKARRINISGNHVWGIHGISVTNYSAVNVGHNTVIRMTDADLSSYAGRRYNSGGTSTTGLTTMPFGWGVEGGACYDIDIHDNVLDGGWSESGGTATSGGQPTAIVVGLDSQSFRAYASVRNNDIRRWYRGIVVDQIENSLFSGNAIRACRTGFECRFDNSSARVSASGFTWKNNTFRNNTLFMDANANASSGSGGNGALIQGDWIIADNTFVGLTGIKNGTYPLRLVGFSTVNGSNADIGSFVLTGNTFRNFDLNCAINLENTASQLVLRAHFDGNMFDSEQSSPIANLAAIRVQRPLTGQTMTLTAGTNSAIRLARVISWDKGATVGTENYNLGRWVTDSNLTRMTTNDGATNYRNDAPEDIPWDISGVIRGKTVCVNVDSGAATQTINDFFPANSLILGVTSYVQTVLVISGGSLYHLGTESDPFAWGKDLSAAADASSGPGDWKCVAWGANNFIGSTAKDLTISTNTGTFTSGRLLVQMMYVSLSGEKQ